MRFAICPSCNTPLAIPGELISTFSFPDGVQSIGALVTGTFNTVNHLCGETISFEIPTVGTWAAQKRIVTTAKLPAATTEMARNENWDVVKVSDYFQLKIVILEWIREETSRFWSVLRAGEYETLSVRATRAITGPLQLLSMAFVRSGLLDIFISSKDDSHPRAAGAPQRVHFENLSAAITAEQVRRVIRTSIVDGLLDGLDHELVKWVPSPCLDNAVLDLLVRDAHQRFEQNDLTSLVEAHVSIISNAVAHRITRIENPLETELAYFAAKLEHLSRQDGVILDERLWLSPHQWRQLLSESAARRAAQILLQLQAPDDEKYASPAQFLSRIGRPDIQIDAAALIALKLVSLSAERMVDLVVDANGIHADVQQSSSDNSWLLGSVLGWLVPAALGGSDSDSMRSRVLEVSAVLEAREDKLAVMGFHTSVIFNLNNQSRHSDALPSATYLKDHYTTDLPSHHLVDLLTEIGNFARYQQAYEAALSAYEEADAISKSIQYGLEERNRVLSRNRAIVLRDSGHLSEARSLLEQLLVVEPDAQDLRESYILLLVALGEFDFALSQIDAVISEPELGTANRARFLQERTIVLAKVGRHDDAVREAKIAVTLVPEGSVRRLLLDAAALEADPTAPELIKFCDSCADHVRKNFGAAALKSMPVAVSVAVISALRHIRRRELEPAVELLEAVASTLERERRGWPWQFSMAVGCYLYHEGHPQSFDFILRAAHEFDALLTRGEDFNSIFGILADQSREELCETGLRAGIAACDRGTASAEDLLTIFDLANGRDLTAGASRRSQIPNVQGIADSLTLAQQAGRFDVVTLIDCDDEIWLIIHPIEGPRRLVCTGIKGAASAVRALRLIEYVNPVAPEAVDGRLEPWWTFAARLAEAIRLELPDPRRLVLVPHVNLLSTPLQAAGWPGRPLITDRAISFSPNHRILASRLPAEEQRSVRVGVIGVPKLAESAEISAALRDTVDSIAAFDSGSIVSFGSEGDEEQALHIMQQATTAYLLCHGVHGGPRLGPGICVAADGQLPAGNLPLVKDPDLGRFILNWDDLIGLHRSPDTVVTIACSSGRTAIGRGGSRIGLEQGSIANHSRYVISPIWNVHQRSAFAWINEFATGMHGHSMEPDEACRRATLDLMRDYPHPYFWAPYLSTTAMRGPTIWTS